jgi:hypothetical protein
VREHPIDLPEHGATNERARAVKVMPYLLLYLLLRKGAASLFTAKGAAALFTAKGVASLLQLWSLAQGNSTKSTGSFLWPRGGRNRKRR